MKPAPALSLTLSLALCSGAAATVFPGGTANSFPLIPFGSSENTCLHEVFLSSLFSNASGGNSVQITSIAFAPGINGADSANVAIRLGYTNAVPGASGATGLQPPTSQSGGGAPNAVGPVATVFAGTPSFNFTSASSSNFQMAYSLQPFTYDPSQGNLLVEIVTGVQSSSNETVSGTLGGGSQASYAFNSTRFGSNTAPTAALHMDFTFTSVATGACCMGDGSCRYIAPQSCATQGGVYAGNNIACAAANCPQPGACCLSDGSCSIRFASACAPAGGTYLGDGIPCSQSVCAAPGACCLGGACSLLPPSQCTAQNGIWQQAPTCSGVTCPSCYAINGGFESGSLTPGWSVVDAQGTWSVTATPDPNVAPHSGTYAALYVGVSRTDPYAALRQIVPVPAGSRAAISAWIFVGNFAAMIPIFDGEPLRGGDIGPTNGWALFQADGLAYHDNPVLEFRVFSVPNATAFACFDDISVCAACYPNCDGSTTQPLLNVTDFTCFLQKFAQGDPYANCDGSTTQPLLNVTDFTCFLQKFAQGCP